MHINYLSKISTILMIIAIAISPIFPIKMVSADSPPGRLVLWNKLGSDYEVLHSEAGPNLNFYDGDRDYIPGKFGNAITIKGNSYDVVHNLVLDNVSNVISTERGCIELWYYQTEIPVAWIYGIYRLFDGYWGLSSGIGFFIWGKRIGLNPDQLSFYLQAGGPEVKIMYDPKLIPNKEWVHLAATWDRNGIGGSAETMRIYMNGIKVAAGTQNNWGHTMGGQADICGGNDGSIAGKFAMDNLKVWNYAKTDFSDRFIEESILINPAGYRWSSAHTPSYKWEPYPKTFKSWQQVRFINNRVDDIYNVTATITRAPANVTVTDGVVNLGNIPAGGSAWSTDDFALVTDMTNKQPANPGIVWKVEYDYG